MPTCIEINNAPQPNGDFLRLSGRGNESLENALFQHQSHDSSPMVLSDIELSTHTFRSQSYTPPIIETTPIVESNHGEGPDVQALLGAGSNFNVSNFLNGILSESTHPSPSRNVIQKPAEVAESDPFKAMTIGVSLDPWNTYDNSATNNTPLDILQGIVNHQNSPLVGVPLTSDSSHLNFTNVEYSGLAYARNVSDEGEDSDSLEPDSFYSQLLGED